MNGERKEVVPTEVSPTVMPDVAATIDHAVDAGIVLGSGSHSVVVDFRCGEAVDRHPALSSLLDEGWSIRRAVPRFIDGEAKMLVILDRHERLYS